MPASSTTLINVEGQVRRRRQTRSGSTAPPPERVLWNFPTTPRASPSQEWKGSILAPDAAFTIPNGQLDGSVAARDVDAPRSPGWTHHPFSGCLPPEPLPPEPSRNLSLVSLCTDPLTLRHALRLRNEDATAYEVHWEDTDSAQSGDLTARASTDTFFDIQGGDEVHHIVVTSGSTTVEATTGTNECGGSIVVSKAVTGEGIPPTGPWAIVIKGGNSFSQTVALVAGAQATVKVPGRYEPGSVGIGEFAGGYDYAISEPEPLGALASVDPTLVTVTNGQTHKVAVTNQYDPVPPEPPDPPSRSRPSRRSRRFRPARPSRYPAPTSCSRPRSAAARTWRSANASPRASARWATWSRSPFGSATSAPCPRTGPSCGRSRRSTRATPTRWPRSSA